MPISKYNSYFSKTKPDAAVKARQAMIKRYGKKKGEQVFYSTLALRKKTGGKDVQSRDKKDGRFDKNQKFSKKSNS